MSFLWDSTGYHMGGKSCVEWKNVLPCWGFTTTWGTLLNQAGFATKLTHRTWKCGSSLARKLEVIFASTTPNPHHSYCGNSATKGDSLNHCLHLQSLSLREGFPSYNPLLARRVTRVT